MSELKEQIKNFIASDEKSLAIPMQPVAKIMNILEKEFDIIENSIDTNGWQVDFWIKLDDMSKESQGNKKYMLSGSLWYGGFVLSKR